MNLFPCRLSSPICVVRGCVRRNLLPVFVLLAAFAALTGVQPSAAAQGVTFVGGQSVLGGGFNTPMGVAVDSSGNVYVADTLNSQIKEILAVNGVIPANPTIEVLAPSFGFSAPQAVAVDASGNVYVADTGNNQIEEILAVNGAIPASNPTVNVLGSGFSYPYGVAVDASGDVYVADTGNNQVKGILAVNGVIPANNPTIEVFNGFSLPIGVAVDASGNVYVGDYGDDALKEILAVNGVVPANPTINILGGISDSEAPDYVAVDASGDVYLSVFPTDTSDDIEEILAVDGVIPANPTIVDVANSLAAPQGVAVDGKGDLFVANTYVSQVVELQMQSVNFGSANVCPAGQTGPAPCSSTLTLNYNVAANTTIGSVKILTTGATNLDFQPQANDASTTLCSAQTYNSAATCTVDVTFAPLAPGERLGAVQIYDQNNNLLASTPIYGTGTGPAITFQPGTQSALGSGFSESGGTAVDASGNVYVADFLNKQVKEILAVNGVIPPNPTIKILSGGFSGPLGVAVDGSGNVYVSDTENNQVDEILAVAGVIPANPTINVLGSGFNGPADLVVDGSGNLFVADVGNGQAKEILAVNGVIPPNPTIRILGSGFVLCYGIALDASGNVYVTDSKLGAVEEILAVNGVIPANPTINVLSNSLGTPTGVAVDASGSVYVANPDNAEVFEILAVNGAVPANNPTIVSLGSGFGEPFGVALDGHGNIYVADVLNSQVYEINVANPPSLGFASTLISQTSTDSPKSVTVQNVGNATLTASNLVLSDATDFAQIAGSGTPPDCAAGFSLTPGAECNLSLEFTPQSAGPLSATLTVTDNNLNANAAPQNTQAISLSGTGLGVVVPNLVGDTESAASAALGAAGLTLGAVTQQYSFTVPAGDVISQDPAAGAAVPNGSAISLTISLGPLQDPVSTTKSTLAAAPNPAAAGGTVTVTATLLDAGGNAINGATANFSSTSATVSFGAPSVNGNVVTVSMTDTAVETAPITATLSGTADGTLSGSAQFVAPSYTVTTLVDPATGNGNAANCVAAGLSGDNSNCSLRDAVAAADALSGVTAMIGFAPALTAGATAASPAILAIAQSTPITMSASMNINGPGANLLTIEGGIAPYNGSTQTANYQVFAMTGGTSMISGVTVANGAYLSSGGGGGMRQSGGALTVSYSTFSGNSAPVVADVGGAIYASGQSLTISNSTLSGNYAFSGGGAIYAYKSAITVSGSTFSGNSAGANGSGGAIYAYKSAVTASSSTFSGNSAVSYGGAIELNEGSALNATDSIFTGNSSQNGGAVYATYTTTATLTNSVFYGNTAYYDNDCAETDGSCAFTNEITANPNLSPLGYYGGPTPTMLPLPGSSAICAGVAESGIIADQRGFGFDPSCPAGAVDVGAVQTDYGLSFSVEPPAGGAPGVALAPAPAVAVTESGVPLTAGSATVAVADADGDLSSASTATASTSTLPASAGQAAFGNLLFKGAAAGDTLTATLTLNANLAPSALALTATSSAFNISQTTPVVSFVPAVSTQAYGAAIPSAALDATASANQAPVAGSFAYTTTIAGAANQPVVAGTTVLPAGSYTITAAFTPADASLYTPASATAAYTVTQASQTIHFAGLPQSVVYSAGLQYTLNATASSGLPVSYSATGPATLNGTTLTITGAGAVQVTASQSGNANYAAAAPVTLTVQVAPAAQKITFNAVPTQTGGTPLNLALYASASSGLPLTFTSETPAVCAVSGSVATVVAVGKCTIQASQPGGSGYAAAAPVAQSFETQKGQQTINFGSIPSPLYVGGKVTLAPTSTSGLPVTLGTGTPAVCTVSGDTVTLVEGGGCNVDATVPGNAIFYPGLGNTGIIVHRLTQIVTLDAVASPQSVGNSVKLGASSNAGLTGFTFASLSTAVCTVAGNTATMVAAGNCYLQACQPGSVDYLPACGGQLVKSDQVKQTIAFGSIPATLYAGGTVKITATASSGLTPVALASTTPAVCTFSGGTATLLQFGDCNIEATQAGNAKYAPVTANLSFLVHHAQ